jgi:hypothetical protein
MTILLLIVGSISHDVTSGPIRQCVEGSVRRIEIASVLLDSSPVFAPKGRFRTHAPPRLDLKLRPAICLPFRCNRPSHEKVSMQEVERQVVVTLPKKRRRKIYGQPACLPRGGHQIKFSISTFLWPHCLRPVHKCESPILPDRHCMTRPKQS